MVSALKLPIMILNCLTWLTCLTCLICFLFRLNPFSWTATTWPTTSRSTSTWSWPWPAPTPGCDTPPTWTWCTPAEISPSSLIPLGSNPGSTLPTSKHSTSSRYYIIINILKLKLDNFQICIFLFRLQILWFTPPPPLMSCFLDVVSHWPLGTQ